MKKSDIETRRGLPALNVKCYDFAHGLDVPKTFGCTEKQAERALEFAWETACEDFWRDLPEYARDILSPRADVFSDGRSGGWLVVKGLPPVESWDAVLCSKWAKFARLARSELRYLASAENVREQIESNEWHKTGAELYNFVDRADGSTVCLADLKAEARAAGFSDVVRA